MRKDMDQIALFVILTSKIHFWQVWGTFQKILHSLLSGYWTKIPLWIQILETIKLRVENKYKLENITSNVYGDDEMKNQKNRDLLYIFY